MEGLLHKVVSHGHIHIREGRDMRIFLGGRRLWEPCHFDVELMGADQRRFGSAFKGPLPTGALAIRAKDMTGSDVRVGGEGGISWQGHFLSHLTFEARGLWAWSEKPELACRTYQFTGVLKGWFLEFGSGTMILEKRSWDTIDCRGGFRPSLVGPSVSAVVPASVTSFGRPPFPVPGGPEGVVVGGKGIA